MNTLLELLAKGLEPSLMDLILPQSRPLEPEEAEHLSSQLTGTALDIGNMLRAGIHYAQSGATRQARALFDKIMGRFPDHIDTRLAWAAMELWTGSPDNALRQLQEAAVHDRTDARLLYAMGHCHERLGRYSDALDCYRAGLGQKPYLRQIRERLAAIHLHQRDYPQAIEQCNAMAQEHPEDVWVYLALGQLYLHIRANDKAVDTFERALTIEPDNFEIRDDSIQELAEAGRIDDAIAGLHDMIAQQGDFPDTYMRLGDLHGQRGDAEDAVTHYGKALDLYPGYLEVAVKLGTQYLRMGRHYEAATNFNRAIEINDRLITAYVGLGIAQSRTGQTPQAQDTLELAGALEPNTNLLFSEMCRLQLKVALAAKDNNDPFSFKSPAQTDKMSMDELLDLQLERHRQSLQERPNQADLHYRYGILLRSTGRTDEAIHHFERAVSINGCYPKARIKLGLALRERGDQKQATENLGTALELTPEHAELHYKLALLYCDKLQFALAVEHFETELQADSDISDVQANITLALQNMGLIDRASAAWRAVCELDPDSPLAFQAQRSISPVQHVT